MTTTDLSPILRTILERPWDDAPRYVYADALDEAGEPGRAEFVRLQLAMPTFQTSLDSAAKVDPARHPDVVRACGLLVECGPAWLGYAGRPEDPRRHWRFRRGLVDWVESGTTSFLGDAKGIFSAWPVTFARLPRLRPHDRGINDEAIYRIRDDVEDGFPGTIPVCLLGRFVKLTTPAPAQYRVTLRQPDGRLDELVFRDGVDAVTAISEMAVAYGRRAAGLPPFPEHLA